MAAQPGDAANAAALGSSGDAALPALSEAGERLWDDGGISAIQDIREISQWEYFLQLSFFTADLHIANAWKLVSSSQLRQFQQFAQTLEGAVVHSVLDLETLKHPVSVEDVLQKKTEIRVESEKFPVGQLLPPLHMETQIQKSFFCLICKVALGATVEFEKVVKPMLQERKEAESFEKCEIPSDYSSMFVHTELQPSTLANPQGPFRTYYRVQRKEQILPFLLVEFEMKPLRMQVPQPICALCEVMPATVFCAADRAHLCDECDQRMHSSSALLARHKRLPASHSPFQFGICLEHPSEMLDCVCMTCFVALCPHCILIGSHSAANFSEHPLISTIDAYKLLMQNNSPSEKALDKRRGQIVSELKATHAKLSDIHSNFLAVQRRIQAAADNLLGQLHAMKHRKTNFLLAIKRELLSEILQMEWLEAFFAHLRLASKPPDFLIFKHKFDIVVARLFGGSTRIEVSIKEMPHFISENFYIEGAFAVSTAPHTLSLLDKNSDEAFRPTTPLAAENDKKSDRDRLTERDACTEEWMNIPSEIEGLMDKGRVAASSKVLPTAAPATAPTLSHAHPELTPEYMPSRKDATADRQLLPPSIKEVYIRAEREMLDHATDNRADFSIREELESAQKISKEACITLWGILSDNHFLPLLTLLKAASSRKRTELLRAACNLANAFSAIPDLARHLFEFELKWVAHLPESLLMHTTSLLFPFLSHVTTSPVLLLPADNLWLQQLLTPLLTAAAAMLQQEQHCSADLKSTSPVKLLRPICTRFLNQLESMTISDLPHTLRGLLYMLTDAVDYHMHVTYTLPEARATATPSVVAAAIYNPRPQNAVSRAAVAACAETLLSCVFADYVMRSMSSKQQLPFKREGDDASFSFREYYTPPYNAERQSTAVVADGALADQLHALSVAADRQLRELPVCSCFSKLLREIARFCWDAAVKVDVQLPQQQKRSEEAAAAADAVAATRKPENAEERFLLEAAQRVMSWSAAQLKLPRMHSPIEFAKNALLRQHTSDKAASDILRFVLETDRDMREGTFCSGTPGLSETEVATPAFEQLLDFAIKIGLYEEDLQEHTRLV